MQITAGKGHNILPPSEKNSSWYVCTTHSYLTFSISQTKEFLLVSLLGEWLGEWLLLQYLFCVVLYLQLCTYARESSLLLMKPGMTLIVFVSSQLSYTRMKYNHNLGNIHV